MGLERRAKGYRKKTYRGEAKREVLHHIGRGAVTQTWGRREKMRIIASQKGTVW